jgi:hypothetical protein
MIGTIILSCCTQQRNPAAIYSTPVKTANNMVISDAVGKQPYHPAYGIQILFIVMVARTTLIQSKMTGMATL